MSIISRLDAAAPTLAHASIVTMPVWTHSGLLLTVSGEIDCSSATDFAATMLDALDRSNTVQLDLSGVTFIDSSGLHALLVAKKSARDGQVLEIAMASMPVRRLLDCTDLTDMFLRREDGEAPAV